MQFFPLLAAAMLFGGQLASAVDISVGGSLRPRVEFVDEGAQGQAVGQSKTHTTMQTRINVKATVDDDVSAFIQIQDVRTWGGEAATPAPPSITQTGTSTTGNLDLHQAYFTVKNVLDSGVGLKIGRQEMVFDEARLIGNIGWIQQAQSFDAARADFDLAALNLTAFYAETVSKDSHPTLGSTLNANASTFESRFSGLRATYSLGGKGDRATAYAYYALRPTRSGAGASATPNVAKNILYTGLYVAKHISGFRVRFDGAYESGDKDNTTSIQAYMLTGAVSTNLDIANGANIALWVDYLSGDDGTDPTKDKHFTTPYATNHKFYGHVDKFLNIPTGGLTDYAVKFWVKPAAKAKFVVHGHIFRSPQAVVSDLGSEIDTQFHYALATNTKLVLGYSRFFAGGTGATGVAGDPSLDTNWAFAMMSMKF